VPGGEWKIAMMTNWSGSSYATTPVTGSDGFSPNPAPPAGAHVTTLPAEYAAYLQAIKDKGGAPDSTRLKPGFFTSGLISDNYISPTDQQREGLRRQPVYTVDPSDPVWQFAGSDGSTAVCGTVHYTDRITATTSPLVQSAGGSEFGDLLPAGIYSSVKITGLHQVCFEVYATAGQPVGVIGTWGDMVSTTGAAIAAQTQPN
jgi:hypothetical protein